MRQAALRSIAIASLLLAASAAAGATRPRYGGTLRVQLAGPMPVFDPASASSLRDRALLPLTHETLTRLNAHGEAEPALATSWQSDPEAKRWRFRLRPRVLFHDGTALTPALAAGVLAAKLPGFEVAAAADGIQITAATSVPGLPAMLADPSLAIVHTRAGTGPFEVARVAADTVVLSAFERHWGGRPFLDAIEFLAPRPGQASLAPTQAWEIPAGAPRRALPERAQMRASAPLELIAVQTAGSLGAALSAAIDRQSMTAVLTRRRAEPSAAVLPQWISGYSFLFPATRDLGRAQRLLAGARPSPVVLSYDPGDGLARIIAERVAVNAHDAGLRIVVKPDPTAPLQLRRFTITPNAAQALSEMAALLGIAEFRPSAAGPEALYAAERAILESGRLVPLMHVPLVFGFDAKVQLPPAEPLPRLRLESAWIAP